MILLLTILGLEHGNSIRINSRRADDCGNSAHQTRIIFYKTLFIRKRAYAISDAAAAGTHIPRVRLVSSRQSIKPYCTAHCISFRKGVAAQKNDFSKSFPQRANLRCRFDVTPRVFIATTVAIPTVNIIIIITVVIVKCLKIISAEYYRNNINLCERHRRRHRLDILIIIVINDDLPSSSDQSDIIII